MTPSIQDPLVPTQDPQVPIQDPLAPIQDPLVRDASKNQNDPPRPPDSKRQTRQEKIADAVRLVLQSEDFPAFSENVQAVLWSSRQSDATISHITSLILKDLGLTTRVLRTANSSLYNRSGKPVVSVAHACSLMGLEGISSLVGGVQFVDHFARRSPGLRQLMMLSLLTANHARQVSIAAGYPRPEEAYLAGMFRNLGEVLVACYRPLDYSKILVARQERKLSERMAAVQVLGFYFEDVAETVAKTWNLPDRMQMCLHLEPGLAFRAGSQEDELLRSITVFSHGLTNSIYRQNATAEPGNLRALIDQYGNRIAIGPAELKEILDSTIEDTAETFQTLRVPLNELLLRTQVEEAISILRGQEEAEHPKPVFELGTIDRINHDAEALISGNEIPNLPAVLTMLTEGIYLSGGFSRVVVALLTETRGEIRGLIGVGTDENALREFSFEVEAGPTGLTVLRKQDLVVNRAKDTRFERSEMVKRLNPRFFALLPVLVNKVVTGVIYMDHLGDFAEPTKELMASIDTTRRLVGEAIARVKGR